MMKLYRVTTDSLYSEIIFGDLFKSKTSWVHYYDIPNGALLLEMAQDTFFVPMIGKFVSTAIVGEPYECIEEISNEAL